MIIGAHVSTAGGLHNSFANAEKIGAQAMQIFGASPRQWKVKMPEEEVLEKFREARKQTKLGPIFLHASYLVNIGTPDNELYEKSIQSLIGHLKIAELIEAEGLIYHIGSYKNSTWEESAKRVVEGMNEALKNSPGKTHLIMENSAGGGSKIGLTLEEIGKIYQLAVETLPSEITSRIKVCIDTAHAFGAGILETFSAEELDDFTKEADQAFGLKNLTVLHINDSLVPFNSKRDRHQNIGEGEIGLKSFKNMSKNKDLNNLPWILEVPGFEKTGPDKRNIDLIKAL
ncbi:deoxyribonuclease IV [Candidatus Peregrinibacteria bacterium]|jgi:deoxyribonuclease IV|nr:deoxyribonuclease IV [Candidatus Peregrinibacteria bacterium]MBT7736386.1 deoxyribonuclease IV [Candidatus Peregrinibacteria bacterium]